MCRKIRWNTLDCFQHFSYLFTTTTNKYVKLFCVPLMNVAKIYMLYMNVAIDVNSMRTIKRHYLTAMMIFCVEFLFVRNEFYFLVDFNEWSI